MKTITREMEIRVLKETKLDILMLLWDAPTKDIKQHYQKQLIEVNQQIKELETNG